MNSSYFIRSFQHEINEKDVYNIKNGNITFPLIISPELRNNSFLTGGVGTSTNWWKIGCSKGSI